MLKSGESVQVQGSAAKPYVVKNHDDLIWSCSCSSWLNCPGHVSSKTCKHIRQVAGVAAEAARIGFVQTGTTTGRMQTAQPNIVITNIVVSSKKPTPALLLAHSWDGALDPTGYWLSEKLDGVRCLFVDGKFISRQGNEYKAPDWFKASLPNCELDGELTCGRGRFSDTISIVKSHNSGDRWKEVKYTVFDAPKYPGSFEVRLAFLKEALNNSLADVQRVLDSQYAHVLEQTRCEGIDHLKKELTRIEALGGEGLMLRQPGSLYEAGRSNTLLKCKSFKDDEATVIGYVPGKGKYKGMTGGLECKFANGVEFRVGSGLSDALRRTPPVVGSVVTVRFFELMKDTGAPRFPTFVALRDYE